MPKDSADSPYREHAPSRAASRHRAGKSAKTSTRPQAAAKAHHRPASTAKSTGPASKKRGRRRKRRGPATHSELTSHPTSRNAQIDTRAWLLSQYGPTCAYCGVVFSSRVMTLDHVAPRRGLTAYDRRDNLVLACRTCNAAKRDQSPLAFLLAVKTRAVNLVKYGGHLSAGLLELARPIAQRHAPIEDAGSRREIWGDTDDDEESPYRD